MNTAQRADRGARKVDADVCLILEGTYPFVHGGVSTWVHQILTGLPDVTFSILFLGGRRKDYGEARYALPDNVVGLQAYYLEDGFRTRPVRRARLSNSNTRALRRLHGHQAEPAGRPPSPPPGSGCPHAQLTDMLGSLERPDGIRAEHFLTSPQAWEFIRELNLERHPDVPFVDYFWTLRQLHAPIFQLSSIADAAPEALAYHTISTGYAGLLGTLIERRRHRPLLLSEHGIYTKERRIDLNQAPWLDTPAHLDQPGLDDPSAHLRRLWVRYFETLGRLTYGSARQIVSLYAGNRQRQHKDGADHSRTRVIVNGIDPARFAEALAGRPAVPPPVVGLIGRVVPIKDIKTFVRAIHATAARLPDVQGWIIGGADEDLNYAAECEALVASLGLDGRVHFLGHQDVRGVLPSLGILMLTSISEAQPLAVLEAFAAGVPCVTTDVGACREQIEGGTPEDRALGAAGRVVPFADTDALADATVELLSDPAAWRTCQEAGLRRVRTYYTQQRMLAAYRDLYHEALEA